MSAAEVEPLVRGFLRDTIGLADTDVGPDTELVTTGLVDSVGLVRLAALLETSCGIRIPDRDIVADHFDTLRAITAYVQRKRAG
ncbi:MAG TPA: acyl carrier protein [Candidatus Binatia bacterium]|nr:acyl carrier protein [Candidatus Binatia bacterium]